MVASKPTAGARAGGARSTDPEPQAEQARPLPLRDLRHGSASSDNVASKLRFVDPRPSRRESGRPKPTAPPRNRTNAAMATRGGGNDVRPRRSGILIGHSHSGSLRTGPIYEYAMRRLRRRATYGQTPRRWCRRSDQVSTDGPDLVRLRQPAVRSLRPGCQRRYRRTDRPAAPKVVATVARPPKLRRAVPIVVHPPAKVSAAGIASLNFPS